MTMLAGLRSLQSIDASSNFLSSSLPTDLTALVNIRTLVLRGNRLSGSVGGVVSLATLVSADLGVNNLTGSIPSEVSRLSNLTYGHSPLANPPTRVGCVVGMLYAQGLSVCTSQAAAVALDLVLDFRLVSLSWTWLGTCHWPGTG